MKQLGFNNYANLIDIINQCNLEIQQDDYIKDLMDLLRMGEIENDVEKHPFLRYIKNKSINSSNEEYLAAKERTFALTSE